MHFSLQPAIPGNGGMAAKGMMAKGRRRKKEKLTMVSAAAELTQQLLFNRV